MKTAHPNLQLCVTHLNASVGERLNQQQLTQAFKQGSVGSLSDRTAAALIGSAFAELSPQTIVLAARESGADIAQVNALYAESLLAHQPRVPSWERAVAHWL